MCHSAENSVRGACSSAPSSVVNVEVRSALVSVNGYPYFALK